ncbi:hypothetical protein [Micromonospora echinospora]|uniref:hypothetical protein n=1 Tax=Micromonospora echinospora TaxID=1877 RepID=UPI001473E386|nr:hypothetical protein [Micromonospora echinospora]
MRARFHSATTRLSALTAVGVLGQLGEIVEARAPRVGICLVEQIRLHHGAGIRP